MKDYVKKEGNEYICEITNIDKPFDGDKIRKKPELTGIGDKYFGKWIEGWIVIIEGEAYYNPAAFDLEGFIERIGKKRVESFGMNLYTIGDKPFDNIEKLLKKCKPIK